MITHSISILFSTASLICIKCHLVASRRVRDVRSTLNATRETTDEVNGVGRVCVRITLENEKTHADGSQTLEVYDLSTITTVLSK